MTSKEIANAQRFLRQENSKQPVTLAPVSREKWPRHASHSGLAEVLRSKTFLVQIFLETPAALRLSVCRTELDQKGKWRDGITWDELMQIKWEAGYGQEWAVELYPDERHIVNVANMRHLWILPGKPAYGWGTTSR
jgi:hypothetical protein